MLRRRRSADCPMRRPIRLFAPIACFGALLFCSPSIVQALPEPGDYVIDDSVDLTGVSGDQLSKPYRPQSLRGRTPLELFEWMGEGRNLRAYGRETIKAKLPPAVDLWSGTAESVVVQLIDRDRAGTRETRPPVQLPEPFELPPSGFVRVEYLSSSCSSPIRTESIIRWDPTSAWFALVGDAELSEGDFAAPEANFRGKTVALDPICQRRSESRVNRAV